MNVQQLLEKLIDETAKQSFVEGSKTRDEDVLGYLISQYFQWDGQKVFDVMHEAFIHCNFHTFAEKIKEEWEKE